MIYSAYSLIADLSFNIFIAVAVLKNSFVFNEILNLWKIVG